MISCPTCPHRILDHSLYRDPTPSAPNDYRWGTCKIDGCNCEGPEPLVVTWSTPAVEPYRPTHPIVRTDLQYLNAPDWLKWIIDRHDGTHRHNLVDEYGARINCPVPGCNVVRDAVKRGDGIPHRARGNASLKRGAPKATQ